ncbi:MAG: alpha/beta fold hydrolase, partial [Alphaproteobacteria bacterium]
MREATTNAAASPQHLARPDGHRLAYRVTAGASPGVVFLGGFMSDMTGTKATHLEAFFRARGHAFVRFDYLGHGASSGRFEEGTIGRWAEDAVAVLDHLTRGPQVLVGSSMGGWLMLLVALARPERVVGLIGVAAAPDFTETMAAALDREARAALERDGVLSLPSAYADEPYTVTRRLIEEGREHLLLREPIPITCPVHLIQGMRDQDVPWETALTLAERLRSEDVVVTLVKDGDHRLSRPEDLER